MVGENKKSGECCVTVCTFKEICNCGDKVLHNNGGNYHEIVKVLQHCSTEKIYVLYTDTRELFAGDSLVLISQDEGLTIVEENEVMEEDEIVDFRKQNDHLEEVTELSELKALVEEYSNLDYVVSMEKNLEEGLIS